MPTQPYKSPDSEPNTQQQQTSSEITNAQPSSSLPPLGKVSTTLTQSYIPDNVVAPDDALSDTATDVEHVPVRDDPRRWPLKRKYLVLAIVTNAAIAVAFSVNIYFPAIDALQRDIHASNLEITLSVSLFILLQGITPLFWAVFSELWGRKAVYLASMSIAVATTVVVSRATNGPVFLTFRVLSAVGSSAIMAIGAGSLADIFESHQRGKMFGVYYAAPLVGPAVGNLLGGALASAANWRATFYFVIGFCALSLLTFMGFPDTYRKERSIAWRMAHERALKQSSMTHSIDQDLESQQQQQRRQHQQRSDSFQRRPTQRLRPSLQDLNPFSAAGRVLKNLKVVAALLCSSILFGAQYSILFVSSTSLAVEPWNYSPIIIGLILVSYGVGQIIGSVGGGAYSDRMLAHLTKKNNGISLPEFRIKSTYIAMPIVVASFTLAGWALQKHWHVASLCVIYVIAGLSNIWCFSSIIAFQVDCSPGQSTTAVACNSAGRGIVGLIASQTAGPIYRSVGQGPLYTGWSILILLSEIFIVYVTAKSEKLRKLENSPQNNQLEMTNASSPSLQPTEIPQENPSESATSKQLNRHENA